MHSSMLAHQTTHWREFLAGSAVGAALLLSGEFAGAADGKKTFTIFHTNDLHSNLIGLGRFETYSIHSQRRQDPRRVRASGDPVREKERRSERSGPCVGTGRG